MTKVKQNILLLHGALGASNVFEPLLPKLRDNFNLHTFDFRGHGIFSADNHITSQTLSEQITQYIEKNQLEGISIFGYSLGGYVALMAALNKPHYIHKIVTLASKFQWDETIADKEISQLETIVNLPNEHPFKKQLIAYHGVTHFQNCIKNIAHLMNDLGANKFLNNKTIPNIKNDTLLLVGELDTMVSSEETAQVFKLLSKSEMQILSATKHPFEKVNYEMLSQILITFFTKQ